MGIAGLQNCRIAESENRKRMAELKHETGDWTSTES
jgi:hypothetical protein